MKYCIHCKKPIPHAKKWDVCNRCPRPEYWKKNQSLGKFNEKNPKWLGDKVGYTGVHFWIIRRLKKPELCQNCHNRKALDLANISQKYKRDLTDWEWLCRKCHMLKDGRMAKLHSKENAVKISASLKGRVLSETHLAKIKKAALARRGKKLSAEHRMKLKGRVPWNKKNVGVISVI